MSVITEFESRLPASRRKTFQTLRGPIDIQRYLDGLAYIAEDRDRCPLDVMKDEQCHCLDGGLLAALALRRNGDPGLLVDLVPAKDHKGLQLDDDHVLAVFRRDGLWGALAKSNFAWLRYREPVYRTLRELVMSYFEVYYSLDGIKTLRAYTRPMDISRHDGLNYAWDECGAARVYKRFYRRKPIALVSAKSEALLQPADQRAYESSVLGVDLRWVYRPKH
jgi:hypothetical protein